MEIRLRLWLVGYYHEKDVGSIVSVIDLSIDIYRQKLL